MELYFYPIQEAADLIAAELVKRGNSSSSKEWVQAIGPRAIFGARAYRRKPTVPNEWVQIIGQAILNGELIATSEDKPIDPARPGAIFAAFNSEIRAENLNKWLDINGCAVQLPIVKTLTPGAKVEAVPVTQIEEPKPWEIADPRDPGPEQSWYTPARYFARQLVKDDSTLLTKRPVLAEKVVQSLTATGYKKRGGKKPLDSGTVLKAFANVLLG